MSDGKNILELVLNQNIAKKFNEIDDGVVKIQKDMDLATDSAGRFLAKMQELSQIFNVSGAGDFAANIDKLVQSMNSLNAAGSNTSGLVKQNEATQQIGQSAVQSVDDVNRLIEAINKLPEALNKSKQGAGGGGEKKSILDSLLFDTSSLEQKRREFSELIRGLELQLSSASQRMRSGSDMNVANSSIYRFYDELANRCRERIENITKGISLNGVMDSWQQQGIFDKIEQGQTTYQKELQKAIADEETLSKIILDIEKEYETLTQKAESYRKAADLGKGMEEQSRTEYTAILQQLADVRAKYQAVSDEIQKVIDTNKKMEQSSKELEGYKKRLEEMAVAWERMKLTGTAYDKNGRMTAEAQQLMEDKKALEEKIRLYQMSADEAIKQEQRKKEEIEKSEKDTASEIKRLLDERLKLLHQIREAETKRDTTQSGTELYRLLNVQIEEYKKRLAEVTEATKNVAKGNESIAAEAAKAYSTKRAEQRVKEEEKYQNAIDKTIKELQRLKDEIDKANQKQARESIGLEGGQAPKTIEQYRIAIQNLKREIGKLDTETQKSKINEYNQKIRQYENEIKKATGTTEKFRNENNRLKNVMQQVAGAFGLYISFQSLINFGKNVAQITGEFELQHRAMQAIIGDMDKANRLWEKTIRLAVRSPYSVKELVTYTKQLAAYRIETEKLYDTTKMLADISSGLGVDMQRLILAYGQVKAANYLRGQELRQFSEAGVNILGELADYFTELQGKAISTGDVFEMVSKRMVKFEDVSEVLHRLTEEGGIFFNMQEIQAETLKGMFMNLKDSWDLMKNEIGESNKGFFVSLVNTAKYVADNWKTVGNTLKWVGGLVVAFMVATRAMRIEMEAAAFVQSGTAITLRGLSGALARYIAAARGATVATHGFSTAIKSIPIYGWILAALSAIIGVISALISKFRQAQQETEEFNESTRKIRNNIAYVDSYTDAIVKLSNEIKSLNEVENKNEDQEKRLKEAQEEREALIKKLAEVNPEYAKTIRNLKDDTEALLKVEKEELSTLRAILALRQAMSEKDIKESIENVNEAADSFNNAQKNMDRNRIAIVDYIGYVDEAGNRHSQFLRDLEAWSGDVVFEWSKIEEAVKKFGDSKGDWLNFEKNYEEFVKEIEGATSGGGYKEATWWETFIDVLLHGQEEVAVMQSRVLGDATGYFKKYKESIENLNVAEEGLVSTTDELIRLYTSQDMYNLLAKSFEEAGDNESEKNRIRKEIAQFWADALDDEGVEGEARKVMEARIIEFLKDSFGISSLNPEVIKDDLRDWQKRFNDAVQRQADELNAKRRELSNDSQKYLPSIELYKITDPSKSLEDAQKEALSRLKATQEKIKSAAVEGQVVISDAELEALKREEEEEKLIIALLGAIQKASGSHGNKALQLLNKQIEAIKNAKKQYEEYKKLYDDVTAFDRTKAAVQELFRELNIEKVLDSNNFEGNSIETQIESWLSSQINAAGKDGRIAIQKYIRELSLAAEQADFSGVVKGFKEGAEKAFSDYDMYKELQKLGIGGDISETVFGVSTKSLKQLEAELERLRDSLYAQYDGTEAVKAYEEMLDKLKELEAKEQVDKLKKYTEYLTKGRDEAVKIHLEELTKIQELDELYGEGKFNETQYNEILRRIKEETQQALDKNAWEDFKGSDFYSAMFEDMAHMADSSIDLMYNKLQNLRNSLSSLDPTQVKEIVSQMDKLDEERRNRHPFRYLIQDIRTLRNWDKKGNANLLAQFVGDEVELERQKAILAEEVAELNAEYNRLSTDEIEGNETDVKTNLDDKERQLADLEKQLIDIKKRIGEINNENQKGQAAYQNINSTLQKSVEYFNNLASAAGTITSGIVDAIGDVDEATKDLVNDIASLVENAGLLVADIVKAIASEGTDVASMIDGLLRTWYIIENALKIGDYTYNKEIEEQTDALEKLEWQYDRLKIARDKAWSVTDLKSKNDAIVENINSQIQAYDRMINAEEQKKYKDEDVIEQYKQERTELYDDLEEHLNSFREAMGGISTDDYGSSAQEFVDAWAEAFMETGDGLEALQETFDEYLKNLVKKQAMERVAKHYLEDIFDMINDAIGDDGLVSIADMDKIREKFDSIAPQFSSAMQAIFESLGIFGDQASGELTGLQKGIQGVTEDTAEIIAAYLNAMRLIVIENGSKVSQLINIIQDTSGLYNPMLVELRNIKNRADDIYYFLNQRRENGTDSLRVYVVNA